MRKGMTIPQKALLMRAHARGGVADKVPPARGNALARRGYGVYFEHIREFRVNEHGWRYAVDGTQLEA